MEMVAKGEAEIGLTYLSEMNQPGISAAGAVPRELAEPNQDFVRIEPPFGDGLQTLC